MTPVSCTGKKAFGHHEIQDDREDQRRRPDEQRGRLAIQYPVERVTVALDHPVEHAARRTREAALALLALGAQEPRAHHRRQGERHHRRDEDRHCERHGELAEQAPDDVAHEKERYQHRDEREGERDDGEADLLRALERGLQRRLAGLDIACDVLDDDDGVVDHEAGGDHQRHQRKVIDREPGEVHDAERADERKRHGNARDDRGAQLAQEDEDHRHDQGYRQQQLDLHVVHRGADRYRAVGEHRDIQGCGQRCLQLRQLALDAIDHVDDVGARLALDVEDDRRHLVHPRGEAQVLGTVHNVGDIGEEHRSAIAVGDDDRLVLRRRGELVVGVDGVGARRPIEATLGALDVRCSNGRAHVFEAEVVRCERVGIRLHAHGGALAAGQRHQPDARHLRELLRQARVGEVLDVGQ